MSKWVNQAVLDDGLNVIVNYCDKMALINQYTPGDSYAAVSAVMLASCTMTPVDFVLSTDAFDNRILTTAADKSAPVVSASSGSAVRHIAFLDTVNGRVLWVTQEGSGMSVQEWNTIIFPPQTLTSYQPI